MSSDTAECIVIDCSSDEEEDDSVQQIVIHKPPGPTSVDVKPRDLVDGQTRDGGGDGSQRSDVVDITTPVKQQQSQQQHQSTPRPQDMSPQELLELRRKKIDQQLDLLERCQQRLSSVTHLMNPVQRQRWDNLARSSRDQPATNGQDSDNQIPSSSTASSQPTAAGGPPTWRRPPWFIDPPSYVGGSGSSYTRRGTTSATAAPPMDDDDLGFSTSASRSAAYARRPRTKFKRKRKSTTTKRRTTSSASTTTRKVRKTASPSKPRASTSSGDRKPKVSKLQTMVAKVKREH